MEHSKDEEKEGQELTISAIYELCHYVDWSAVRDVLFNQKWILNPLMHERIHS